MNYLFKKYFFPKPNLILLLEQEVRWYAGRSKWVANIKSTQNKHIYELFGKRVRGG